jgi:hypothetical protein
MKRPIFLGKSAFLPLPLFFLKKPARINLPKISNLKVRVRSGVSMLYKNG